jgi:predicted short-subunit dehydrogenase-like oxidoreductase (DUF2520 family)
MEPGKFQADPRADMLPTMTPRAAGRPNIAIVGAGNLGSALAVLLRAAGYKVSEIVSREGKVSRRRAKALARRVGARAAQLGNADITARVVWLCVPDQEIASCARSLGGLDWEGRIALHSSGALRSDELASLRRQGGRVASVHPMMTFVPGVTPSLAGVGFAVEGDREAVRIARKIVAALGGESFLIAKKDKALYHAWGMFASPLLTALLAIGEQVAGAAGIPGGRARRRMVPIVRQTVENYASRGAAQGFSGPIIRGDTATIRKHLQDLRAVPAGRAVYLALARAAIRTLPTRNRKQVKALLG